MQEHVTLRSELLGNELKKARERRGLTLNDVGPALTASTSKMSRMESGTRTPTVEDVSTLCGAYGVNGPEREFLLDMTRHVTETTWVLINRYDTALRALTFLERRTYNMVCYQAVHVPGLLQTGEYIRVIMRAAGVPEDSIESRLMDRVQRQRLLRKNGSLTFVSLIDQDVLTRKIGDRDVHRRQLEHLVESVMQLPVAIRAIPHSVAEHPTIDGSFIRLDIHGRPPVIYYENHWFSAFLEDPADVADFNAMLGKLDKLALSTVESVHMIADLAAELE